jgi:hypothetical protein
MVPILILLFDLDNEKPVIILVNDDVNEMTEATHNRHKIRIHRGVIAIAEGPVMTIDAASN